MPDGFRSPTQRSLAVIETKPPFREVFCRISAVAVAPVLLVFSYGFSVLSPVPFSHRASGISSFRSPSSASSAAYALR